MPLAGIPYFPPPPFVPGVQVAHGFCSVCQLGQQPHCLYIPRLLGRSILGTSWALVMCFSRTEASVHLHPWDAVDVLLGLQCPLIVVFVYLSVMELSFFFWFMLVS